MLATKRKRCKHCRDLFSPRSSFQVVCSPNCAVSYCKTQASVEHRKAVERMETREAKKRTKSKAQWRKEAQAAFNAYIRERDRDQPCISCGRHHDGQYHAGHYRTTASAPELRFYEDNCHKQCAPCNNHLSGNIAEYRKALVTKIGIERLDSLEGPHEPMRYTIEDYQRIKDKYKKNLNAIKT